MNINGVNQQQTFKGAYGNIGGTWYDLAQSKLIKPSDLKEICQHKKPVSLSIDGHAQRGNRISSFVSDVILTGKEASQFRKLDPLKIPAGQKVRNIVMEQRNLLNEHLGGLRINMVGSPNIQKVPQKSILA